MLTIRMQTQAIADRLAGIPVDARATDFIHPWHLCWQALEKSQPGHEQQELQNALSGLPEAAEILQAILATRPGYKPSFQSLEDIGPGLPPIEWVWDKWIPRGMVTVLGASQGSGKSFVAADLAWRVIHNQGFPDGSPVKRPGANVIYVDGEMVPQILNLRAQQYGLDRSKLYMLLAEHGEMLDLGQQVYQDRLSEMAEVLKPELIVIDSLSSIHTSGQNGVEDVRKLIGYIVRLAGWANCGLVLIHHIRKTPNGNRMMSADFGIEDLSGTGYITQQARVVLQLRVVQTGPKFDPNGPREFKVIKNNLGAYPDAIGFSFAPLHPEGVIIKWDAKAPQPYREPTKMDECMEWLEDLLRANPGGMKPKDVIAAGMEEGFKRDMLYAARKELRPYIRDTQGRKAPGNLWVWSDDPQPGDTPEEA